MKMIWSMEAGGHGFESQVKQNQDSTGFQELGDVA